MKHSRLADLNLADITRNLVNGDITPKTERIDRNNVDLLQRYADEYSCGGSRGTAVYIDDSLMKAVVRLKGTVVDAPARHIINGMLRAYIEEHREELTSCLIDREDNINKIL